MTAIEIIKTQASELAIQDLKTSAKLLLTSLTKREADRVDWFDEWQPYSSGQMQHKLTGEVTNKIDMKIKVWTQEHPKYLMGITALEMADAYMRTPTEAEFFTIFTELRLFCVDKNLDVNAMEVFLRAYYDSLKDYPAALLKEAAADWRQRNDTPLYFPTIGKLKDEMHYRLYSMRKTHKRIAALVGQKRDDVKKNAGVSQMMSELLSGMQRGSE